MSNGNGQEPSDTTQWSSDNPFAPTDTTTASQWSDDNPFVTDSTIAPVKPPPTDWVKALMNFDQGITTGLKKGIAGAADFMLRLARYPFRPMTQEELDNPQIRGVLLKYGFNPESPTMKAQLTKDPEELKREGKDLAVGSVIGIPQTIWQGGKELFGPDRTAFERGQGLGTLGLGLYGAYGIGKDFLPKKKTAPTPPLPEEPPGAPPPPPAAAGPVVSPEETTGTFAEAQTPEQRAAIAAQQLEKGKAVADANKAAIDKLRRTKNSWDKLLSPEQRKSLVPGLADVDYGKTWEDLSGEAKRTIKKAFNVPEMPSVTNLVPSEAQKAQVFPEDPNLKTMSVEELNAEINKATGMLGKEESAYNQRPGRPGLTPKSFAHQYLEDHIRQLEAELAGRPGAAPPPPTAPPVGETPVAPTSEAGVALHEPGPPQGPMPHPAEPDPIMLDRMRRRRALGFDIPGKPNVYKHTIDLTRARLVKEGLELGEAERERLVEGLVMREHWAYDKYKEITGKEYGGLGPLHGFELDAEEARGGGPKQVPAANIPKDVLHEGVPAIDAKEAEIASEKQKAKNAERVRQALSEHKETERKLQNSWKTVSDAFKQALDPANADKDWIDLPFDTKHRLAEWVLKRGENFDPSIEAPVHWTPEERARFGNKAAPPPSAPSDPKIAGLAKITSRLEKPPKITPTPGSTDLWTILQMDDYDKIAYYREDLTTDQVKQISPDWTPPVAAPPPPKPQDNAAALDAEYDRLSQEKLNEYQKYFKEQEDALNQLPEDMTPDEQDAEAKIKGLDIRPPYERPEAMDVFSEHIKALEQKRSLPKEYRQGKVDEAQKVVDDAVADYNEVRKTNSYSSRAADNARHVISEAKYKLRNVREAYGIDEPPRSGLYKSVAKKYKDAGIGYEPPSNPGAKFLTDPKVIAKIKEYYDHTREIPKRDEDSFTGVEFEKWVNKRDSIIDDLSSLISEKDLQKYFEHGFDLTTSESVDQILYHALQEQRGVLAKQIDAAKEIRNFIQDQIEGKEEGMYQIDPSMLEGAEGFDEVIQRLDDIGGNPELALKELNKIDELIDKLEKQQAAVEGITKEPPPPDAGSPAKLTPQGPQFPGGKTDANVQNAIDDLVGKGEVLEPPIEKPESGRRRHGFDKGKGGLPGPELIKALQDHETESWRIAGDDSLSPAEKNKLWEENRAEINKLLPEKVIKALEDNNNLSPEFDWPDQAALAILQYKDWFKHWKVPDNARIILQGWRNSLIPTKEGLERPTAVSEAEKPMGEQNLEELQAALLEYESRPNPTQGTLDTIDALKDLIRERLEGEPPDLPFSTLGETGLSPDDISKFSAFDNDQLLAHFEQTKERLRSTSDPADINDLAAMYDLTLKEIKRRKLSIPIRGEDSLERNRRAAADREAAEEVIGQPPTVGAAAVAKAIYNAGPGLERGTSWNDLTPVEQQSYIRLARSRLGTIDLGGIRAIMDDLGTALDNGLITEREHEAGLAELVERQSSLTAGRHVNKAEVEQIIQETTKPGAPLKPGQSPPVLGFKLPDTVTYNAATGELVPKDLNKFSMDQLKNTIRSIGAMLQSPDVQKITKVADGLKKEMDRIWDYRQKIQEELDKGQAGPGLTMHKIDVPGLPTPPEDVYFSKKIVTGAWLKRPFNIGKFFRSVYQGTVKYSHALNVDDRLYEGAAGEKLPTHQQAGKLAEMFDGWMVKAESFAKGDGPFVPDDKGFTQLTGAKSLSDIIVNTAKSDVERFGWLWAARRALDLMATQGKDIGVDLGHATDMVIKSPQNLHKAVDEGRAYHSGLSAYAVWGGLIDAVRRGQMETEMAYGPIRRMYGPDAVIQKIAKLIQSTGKTATTIRASEEFKKLKGSNLLIRNMVEQSLDVTHRIIRAADQNKLYQVLVQHAIDQPEAFKGLIEPFNHRERLAITKEMSARTEAVKALFKDEGIDISTRHADVFANMLGDEALNVEGGKLIVMREGKIEPWRVDELTAQSLKAMSPEQLGLFVKMMGNGFEFRGHQIPGIARVARAGIVGDIKFLADVFIGDQFQSFINSNYNMIPVIHPFKAWWNIIHNSESFKEAVRAGGIEKASLRGRTTFDDLLAGPNPSPLDLAVKQIKEVHPIRAFWTIITPMREAARFAEYQLARGAGETPVAAAWAARDLNGNYSLHGTFTTIRALNQMSLFFGPAVSVLDKTLRTIKDHPGRWFARASTIAAVSYLMYLANEGDDEIQDLRQTSGGQRWWLVRMPHWVPLLGGQIVKIRKPYFEGAVFGDGIEAAMDAYRKNNPDAFRIWADGIKQELTLDMLPVFGAVPAQIYFNQDIHTGSPIIPESQKNLDPEYQTGYYSGSAERIIGKSLGISPAILNYAARGFTGYLGESGWRIASGALDWQATRELPPAEEWPFMQRVFASYPSYSVKPVRDFYELADRVDNASQTIAYVIHHDPENFEAVIRRHEADGQLAGMVNRTRQQISDLRRSIQLIDDIKDIGPQTKKIYRDQYIKVIIELTRSASQVGRAVEDSYK